MQRHRPKVRGAAARQMTVVSLATNLDARYWMQVLGVSRMQLTDAVQAVGADVDKITEYLRLPERRHPFQ
jgi:hypothetical protein